MAGAQKPGPICQHTSPQRVDDGTLARAETPTPGPIGQHRSSTTRPRRKIRIVGFDGAKTYSFLLQVATAEMEYRELTANPERWLNHQTAPPQAVARATVLYRQFLEACSKGHKSAGAFLKDQHAGYRNYLQQSMAILESLRQKGLHDQLVLARMAFYAQAVKSAATSFLAVGGIFLEGLPALAGAGLALTYDVGMEFIKQIEPSHETGADHVIVGFKQTVTNDAVSGVGTGQQLWFKAIAEIKELTLRHPQKSSIYRAAVAEAARLDHLLKTLGGLSALTTMWTEAWDSYGAYQELQKAADAR